MKFNYNKLRGKIREMFKTQEEFSRALNISDTSLTNKLNNYTYFTQSEINKSVKLLDLNLSDVGLYFFTEEIE